MIAGLLLAAGRGRRYGGDKLLAQLGDRPVLAWSAAALAAAVDATWVVVPPGSPGLRGALAALDVTIVEHAGRDAGMGSSIAAGVRQLPSDVDAVVVALGDQPLVACEVAAALVERWRATGAPVVAPAYLDGRGHPVLFDRACFQALGALAADEGARSVVAGLQARLQLVPVDARMPLDVDTPEALADVARGLAASRARRGR
jgi:molybdenum cofactor cytidylyltransferase